MASLAGGRPDGLGRSLKKKWILFEEVAPLHFSKLDRGHTSLPVEKTADLPGSDTEAYRVVTFIFAPAFSTMSSKA